MHSVSTNSEKFPNIFEVADSNFYVYLDKLSVILSLSQLLPNLLGNFSGFVLTVQYPTGNAPTERQCSY